MVSFFTPPPTAPNGSYVVTVPARTDAIGAILRASFAPEGEAVEPIERLLDRLDRLTD